MAGIKVSISEDEREVKVNGAEESHLLSISSFGSELRQDNEDRDLKANHPRALSLTSFFYAIFEPLSMRRGSKISAKKKLTQIILPCSQRSRNKLCDTVLHCTE